MKFNTHSELEGRHAFLSASKHHWVRYDEEKLVNSFRTALAAMKGTQLHELAASMITHGIKPTKTAKTFNMYVNDAIGFRMSPEVMLFYSPNSFGTADAISFRRERGIDKMVLRIHDLKTGVNAASIEQLQIYAALFCLEYGQKPAELVIELRIYQNDDVVIENPDYDVITHIMDRIVTADKIIERIKQEDLG